MNCSLMRPRAFPGKRAQRTHATTLACLLLFTQALPVWALTPPQDPVTGAFEGTVSNSRTGTPIPGAVVQFINTITEVPVAKRADAQGRFYQGLLQPGFYRIRVSAPGYQTRIVEQRLLATKGNTVVPLPVTLDPEAVVAATPTTTAPTQPSTTPAPPAPTPAPVVSSDVTAELNTTDGRRSGAFTEEEVANLPLGGNTYTRTFDNFAMLVPGVALPPQTLGRVAGPGVGSGVGSAGQFAVNGLRSRANNFLVDGSDNNDEDIGVRRQGFFTLVPQPPESIREYQVITALAPAQFGRNIGAQVNAISKSGGYQTHGTFYGFLNTTDLNARDFFDTEAPRAETTLQGRVLNLNNFTLGGLRDVFVTRVNGSTNLGRTQVRVSNPAFKQDSQTFAQSGFVLGGPLLPRPAATTGTPTGTATPDGANKSAFYFMSFEGQILNANRETNFAVPTVEQRGFFNSGATGLNDLFGSETYPTSLQGDAVFSLFPFPNNPNGVYGRNTYTQLLPASAQGYVASFKMDHTRQLWGREQSFTGRYNRTNDWRNIPATGGGLYATLRPVVGTQNFSFFWNSEVSGTDAVTPIFNQFRASYGRTRLNFEEEADREQLIPSSIYPNLPFLLNAPLLLNATQPSDRTTEYILRTDRNTEKGLLFNGGFGNISGGAIGPVGQIIVPGFSPLGVDVNNFPQRRVNNTFQIADILSLRKGLHNVALGTDIRRVQLNSDLPRNARTQLVFGGAPGLFFDIANQQLVNFRLNDFVAPSSLVAAGAASSSFTTLATTTSNIGLRYMQYNFFAQDEWRARPNLSFTYGLRYEYNSPPSEVDRLIENSFGNAALNLPGVAGLKQFIGGRKGIFDPDRNNFAPRVGFAWSPTLGNNTRPFVVRGGYGLYYDQILGAVVSQSRNVFPNFLTINTGGGLRGNTIGGANLFAFNIFNAGQSLSGSDFSNGINTGGRFLPYVVPGSLNRFNPNLPTDVLVNVLNRETGSGFGLTLPSRNLPMPLAHQFSLSVEHQLTSNLVASASYMGTRGSKLLRLTTPNLGPNLIALASPFLLIAEEDEESPSFGSPTLYGAIIGPGQRLTTTGAPSGGRPVANAGTIYRYETTAESRYDSLQLQLRGRFRTALSWQVGYTWSNARDDASDVFDLAGAFALPQNSLTKSGEYGPSNYDTRHRLAYNVNWLLPTLAGASKAKQLILGGFEINSLGQFQTGQPYTVNSILDINLDGNYTDRLNTTNGLQFVNNGRERVRLNTNFGSLWAPLGQNGALARNTFRGNNYLLLDLAIVKNFNITERQRLTLRTEAFNFLNHANFALPVRFLEAPSFGQAVDTVTPGRRIQFALKYSF